MKKLLKHIPIPNSEKLFKIITAHNRRYSEAFISEQAKKDAKIGIPKVDSIDQAPFIKRLREERTIVLSKITTQYKLALEMLFARIEAEQEYVDSVQEHTQDTIKRSSEVEENIIINTKIIGDAQGYLETSEERYNTMYKDIGRLPSVYIPSWLYWVLATVIFLGEIPLNALVFQIFGENQIMTWVMAFVIGLSVPLSAHFIGIKFREKSEGWWFSNYIKGFLSLATIVAALYGLSEIRTTFLSEFKEDYGLTDKLVQSTHLFFWLNVAVLGAAVVISYLSHDPNPGFEASKKDYDKARTRMEKLERKRLKLLKKSRFRKIKSLKDSDREYRDGKGRVNFLKGYYDMILNEGQELERQCLAGLRHDIEIYRQENLRARECKTAPESFKVDIELPFSLKFLNEMLEN